MKKYIIKSADENSYWSYMYEWSEDIRTAEPFDTLEEAEEFLLKQTPGIYKIITLYFVGL